MRWESSKYDLDSLSWDEIADIWVEDLGMSFGSACSALSVILRWFNAGYVNNGNTNMYASVKIKRHE
jgi:hypothetical protein